MNFIKAIQHATIGYGIRRAAWNPKAILSLDNFGEFHWLNVDKSYPERETAKLLGTDPSYHLSADDVKAKDWETI